MDQVNLGDDGYRGSYAGRGPKGYARSDERVREDVCERLSRDHAIDASEISVEVRQGDVTLTGTVSDRGQKRQAESCLDDVRGVRDVINRLRVQHEGTSGDGRVGDEITFLGPGAVVS